MRASFYLKIGLTFAAQKYRSDPNPAYVKDVSLGHGLMERDAVPAGGGSSLPLPGVSGIMPVSITTDTRGASLEVRVISHEAWPEVSLWDGKSLW